MSEHCPRASSTKTRIETRYHVCVAESAAKSEGEFHENKD